MIELDDISPAEDTRLGLFEPGEPRLYETLDPSVLSLVEEVTHDIPEPGDAFPTTWGKTNFEGKGDRG